MIKKVSRNEMRLERHSRIRKDLMGTSERPRLNVFRANANISAQIIDDEKGVTLVSASTLEKELNIKNGGNIEAAKIIGAEIAKRAKKAKRKVIPSLVLKKLKRTEVLPSPKARKQSQGLRVREAKKLENLKNQKNKLLLLLSNM